MKNKVAIIGSGNWGTAIATVIQKAIANNKDFEKQINMWTFEEMVNNKKLTEIINENNENVKYLPGVNLSKDIVAVPDIEVAIKDSNVLVFVVPHQFIKRVCDKIKHLIRKDAIAVSLIKGIIVENNEIKLISDYIKDELGIECGVLMGANIANEIGEGCISEGTLACDNENTSKIMHQVFNSPEYVVTCVKDKNGVELCGTLKNIVSLGYGIGNGINLKTNTKVAILRKGLLEMVKFCKMFYDNVKLETFFESAGIADLFVSSLCGRNFKCGVNLGKNKSIKEIEESMEGQKLQGTLTVKEIYGFLKNKSKESEFPMFVMVYKICFEGEKCDSIVKVITNTEM